MYLNRIPKVESNEKIDELTNIEAESNEELIAKAKEINEGFDAERHLNESEYFKVGWVGKEVGYWRKANHIHRWFVDNVQNGVDECEPHIVTKEKLEELLKAAKASTTPAKAKKALPTQSGFFFGGTDYDEWYFQDNADTVKILEEVLASTDFEKETVYYCSSW